MPDPAPPRLRLAEVADATAVAELFAAELIGDADGDVGRPQVVAELIGTRGAVVALVDEHLIGAVLLGGGDPDIVEWVGPVAGPDAPAGLDDDLLAAAEQVAAEAGFRAARVDVGSAGSLGPTVWAERGYLTHATTTMIKTMPTAVWVDTAERMHALGARLADLLAPGDLIIASGDLGAGKTTLTQGIGAGLGVTDDITSPTFVLSRVHRSGHGRPDLVHVDAYRLGGLAEIEDLDLDTDAEQVVTVVEWGRGAAEGLTDHRLEITVLRSEADADDDPDVAGADGSTDDEANARLVLITGVGQRWAAVDLAVLADEPGPPADEPEQGDQR